MGFSKCTVLFVLLLGVTIECQLNCDSYTAYDDAGGWLQYNEEPADWNTARRQCALEGALLATPKNESLSLTMKTITVENAPYAIYIGIRKSHFTGSFMSVEGTPLAKIPHKWAIAKGEPNNENGAEDCLIFNHDGRMEDVDCNRNFPYICFSSYENYKKLCQTGA